MHLKIFLIIVLITLLFFVVLFLLPPDDEVLPLPSIHEVETIGFEEIITTGPDTSAHTSRQQAYPEIYEEIVPEEMHYIIPVVMEEAEKNSLDPLYVFSVIQQESDFDPEAVSEKQSMGLMQIYIGTLPHLANILGYPATKETAFDPVKNIRMGCYYLGQHYSRFGDLYLTATAYNAGERAARSGRNTYSISVMAQYRQYQAKEAIISAD
jgi:soluble lytic murein transglycosylase-like protein